MNAHVWSVVCAYCICLSNKEMHRCANFLADLLSVCLYVCSGTFAYAYECE